MKLVEPIFLKKTERGELLEIAYFRKAVKRHSCRECKCLIPVGESYVEDRINKVWHYRDGRSFKRWMLLKICQDCWKAPFGAIRIREVA